MKKPRVEHRRQRNDWGTPPKLFEYLSERYDISCDLAASDDNALCKRYLTEKESAKNALTYDWRKIIKKGTYGFCYPPYKLTAKFLQRAAEFKVLYGLRTIFLVACRPCTNYWVNDVHGHATPYFIQGRIKFVGAEDPAPFESAFLDYSKSDYDYKYLVLALPPELRGYEKNEPELATAIS